MNAKQKAIVFAWFSLAAPVVAMSVKEALGQIESGANKPQQCAADFLRGSAGEISRYQLLPSVWRAYGSGDPTDPTNAWVVATLVIQERTAAFERAVHRQPTPRELYTLWTAPGQFAKRGYDWQRLSPAVRERSQRFANLMEVKNQNHLELEGSALRPATTNSVVIPGNTIKLSIPDGKSVVVSK